ncbi:MAG: amidase [Alphaproteobacteria bacterium]|jgi:aspartyl-tRNA(Asn)/glutamyl-tRNA(Gln) amidotransferase subunit A|nr:MAG: amidase [Alphaproteobacteria bacterium]
MTVLPPDPLESGGIAEYGKRLRAGDITAEDATVAYLDRIEALDPKLGAYEYIAGEQALKAARALDLLLAAGTDLGPLMGVPVAIKDLFAVEGMPAHAGSNLDLSDVIGVEGSFVKRLKRAGCVILGKTKTVEFALGTTGISKPRGTPWNPWDAKVHRVPGGSSSGSGVSAAASLCGFAIGTDTGGSVRLPASFCGVFGLKTTVGLWPTDGVFPLSPDLDSIGLMTRSAADAALVFAALTRQPVPRARPRRGLRLGRPSNYFFDNLEKQVEQCLEAALAALAEAGVEIVPVEVPEAPEREKYFPVALPADLITVLGRERFVEGRDAIDPIVAARGEVGLDVGAPEYNRLQRRRRELCDSVKERFRGLDGWLTPTIARVTVPLSDFDDLEEGMKLTLAITQATQPVNLLALCSTSTPIQQLGAQLPVGLQVVCPGGGDADALSIALAIEDVVGSPPHPDLSGFLD